MRRREQNVKKNGIGLYIMLLLFLILTLSAGYFGYILQSFNNVENTLRLIIGIVVGIFYLLVSFKLFNSVKKKKLKFYIRNGIVSLIFSAILLGIAVIAGQALDKLGNFSTNSTTYSSSIVSLKDNKANELEDIGDKTIGMINDSKNVDGYQIPKEIIEDNNLKNKIKEYDSYPALLDALLEEEVEFVFLPTNYAVKFKSMEAYEDLGDKTKIIYTQKKEIKSASKAGKKLTEPFTVLLMGVDSEEEDISNSSYNGDSLMLITFNPKTLNTTIMSIPRDTYVPIACFSGQRKNKITHAAWYGEDCMIKTIAGFTGIDIDYYAKINFKGVVKLVDTLGGIEADVPLGFCEQDSNRNFGNLQCVKEGKQTLNGEQALAWARHRKSAGFDDFVRGQNQQEVVKGILNKLKGIRSLNKLYEVLDTLGTSMETNMSRDEILSLYNVGKDVLAKASNKDAKMEDLFSMQKLYISGYDEYIYDYSQKDGSGTRMNLYNFVPYDESLEEVIDAMKVNLGLKKATPVKSFAFDVNDEYEEKVIGKGSYSGTSVTLLPTFVGYNQSKATSFGSQNGIRIIVKEVSGSTLGMVVAQSVNAGADIDYISSVTISVVTTKTGGTSSNSSSSSSVEDEDEDLPPTPTPTPSPTPTPTPDASEE